MDDLYDWYAVIGKALGEGVHKKTVEPLFDGKSYNEMQVEETPEPRGWNDNESNTVSSFEWWKNPAAPAELTLEDMGQALERFYSEMGDRVVHPNAGMRLNVGDWVYMDREGNVQKVPEQDGLGDDTPYKSYQRSLKITEKAVREFGDLYLPMQGHQHEPPYETSPTDDLVLRLSKPIKVDDVADIIPIPPLSRCCNAPTFRDGSRLVCEKCRLSKEI